MCKVSGKSKYRLDSGSVSFTDDRNVFGIDVGPFERVCNFFLATFSKLQGKIFPNL